MQNQLLSRLRTRRGVIGSWLNLASPIATELLAYTGFDFLVVDTEHSPTDTETLIQMLQAMQGTPVAPLARVMGNDVNLIKRVLDAGVYGIVIPMVNTPDEARRAIASCRYPPQGVRSVGGLRPPLSFGVPRAEYLAEANREVLVALQVEHTDALSRLEEIAALPGFDCLFVGPNDLCASLGLPPLLEPTYPTYEAALQYIVTVAQRHEKVAGILTGTASTARQRWEQGFRLIAIGSDAALMTGAAQAVVTSAREFRGD
ncbi:MAG: aldolase/citrate lyase family protein [Chloroflexi bacterium]|nr:aldolase/citrate lyase family protein [Chloroflexota bacterium]